MHIRERKYDLIKTKACNNNGKIKVDLIYARKKSFKFFADHNRFRQA